MNGEKIRRKKKEFWEKPTFLIWTVGWLTVPATRAGRTGQHTLCSKTPGAEGWAEQWVKLKAENQWTVPK